MFVVYINYPLTISNNLIYNALILKRLICKQKKNTCAFETLG